MPAKKGARARECCIVAGFPTSKSLIALHPISRICRFLLERLISAAFVDGKPAIPAPSDMLKAASNSFWLTIRCCGSINVRKRRSQ